MLLLAIETTCDETAAALITGEREVLSAVVASQNFLHERFGGVVPELASRAHVERILPVIDDALRQANRKLTDLDAIAVANAPGLAGSLLVGLSAAKSLCVALGIPLVAVNHLQAHIYACRLAAGEEVFPCVGLIVSGGHTSLYRCRSPLEFEPLGGTIDDAAGEAFDKVASLLGLPYPGGPSIQKVAEGGNPRAHSFPRAFATDHERLDFSFSGLKTAVRYKIAKCGATEEELRQAVATLEAKEVADLAASFQEAVVEVIAVKAVQAIQRTGCRTLCVGGGVAANSRLRDILADAARRHKFRLVIAPPALCTDNAVMGAIALERLQSGLVADLDLGYCPRAGAMNRYMNFDCICNAYEPPKMLYPENFQNFLYVGKSARYRAGQWFLALPRRNHQSRLGTCPA